MWHSYFTITLTRNRIATAKEQCWLTVVRTSIQTARKKPSATSFSPAAGTTTVKKQPKDRPISSVPSKMLRRSMKLTLRSFRIQRRIDNRDGNFSLEFRSPCQGRLKEAELFESASHLRHVRSLYSMRIDKKSTCNHTKQTCAFSKHEPSPLPEIVDMDP